MPNNVEYIEPEDLINIVKLQQLMRMARVELANERRLIITTLGRGGTELLAAALQNYLKAKGFWLKGEVGGVHTADPRVVPGAPIIPYLHYRAAAECAGVQKRAVDYIHTPTPSRGSYIKLRKPEKLEK